MISPTKNSRPKANNRQLQVVSRCSKYLSRLETHLELHLYDINLNI